MASGDPKGREWIVLLEAEDELGRSRLDAPGFRRLVNAWPTPGPTALYSESRYALQVSVRAFNAPSALSSAMWLWKDALRRTGLPDWQLVRAEVLTPDELERELQSADAAAGDAAGDPDDGHHVVSEVEQSTEDVVADELLRRALHDAVTGLPERELFLDQVRRALTVGTARRGVHAVFVVNLGRLLGPTPPDTVLVEVSRRLTDGLRPGDTVARVGPGQFAVLTHLPSRSHSEGLTRRIAATVAAPLLHDGRTMVVSAGVGVATTAGGGDADDLVAMAEAAMASP